MWVKHMISANMPADEIEIGFCPQLCEICPMLVEQCPWKNNQKLFFVYAAVVGSLVASLAVDFSRLDNYLDVLRQYLATWSTRVIFTV